jgi:hypothetical protein
MDKEPKRAKGGVFAPTDISLIRLALVHYAQHSELSREDEAKIMSLLHRLNRINEA